VRSLTPIGGIHSVRTALKFGGEAVHEVWLERGRRDHRLGQIADLARLGGIVVRQADKVEIERAAAGLNHQGALAWVRTPAPRTEQDLEEILEVAQAPPFLLILDGVQDPHNLGACLRTADASGVQAVVAPKDNAVGLTPVVCKVASGAAETVPYVQVTNLARAMDVLKERGIWLIGTAGEAEGTLFGTDMTGALGLVMGGEGKGLRRLTRERCDLLVRLPMRGAVESLNVSVAAGICLYEAVRQRLAAAEGKIGIRPLGR
jgi:23S rRNA (guanosine2251-2'-O)-methyltransferase